MGFWIFMAVMELLIPVLMLAFGNILMKHPPKTINAVYGYRTPMSMKNEETWIFAQKYCGSIWRKLGAGMLGLTVLSMLPLLGKEEDTIGNWGCVIEIVQVAILIGSIVPVERALRKNFDKMGNRRDRQSGLV